MVINAFVDDSSAQEGDQELCLAGYVAPASVWEEFSDDWQLVLDSPPAIKGFHAVDAQGLKGEFLGWAEADRDLKVLQLAKVVRDYDVMSFDARVSRRAYRDIVLPVAHFDIKDPYALLFHAVMHVVAHQLHDRNIIVPVDFVFDEQGRVGVEAALWYGTLRATLPSHIRKLLGNRPIFRSDDQLIPLQAADCLAWHLRRGRDYQYLHERRRALKMLRKPSHAFTHLDDDYLRYAAKLMETFVPTRDRLRKGASITQFMKRLEGAIMKVPPDEQEGEYERFNQAMEKLLKVPPQVVKDAMEQEKKERAEERGRKAKSKSND